MSDDALGNEELEELLRSMESGGAVSPTPVAASARSEEDSPRPSAKTAAAVPRQRVVTYDFKRPERVGKDQMRALQSLHEGFARNFGATLSALLRTIAESKLISVDQLTYSEFVYSLEIPTCFNLLRPTPLDGNWILDISPSILYPMIDRMLGGKSSGDSTLKRPLSDIELRLTSRVTSAFLRNLREAWANAVQLDIQVERVESNPQLVQIVPPNEVVILVSLEIVVANTRGTINLCIPFNTIERIGSKLTSNSWIGYASSRSSLKTAKQIEALIDHSSVEVVVDLVNTDIRAVDLINLQVGDIITTDKDCRSPLEVSIAGVGKFEARAGSFKGRKAVEITNIIHNEASQPDNSSKEAVA